MKNVILNLVCALILSLVLSACAHPITIIGTAGERVDESQVAIYYPQRPECNFETIGLIFIEGGYYSLQALFSKMRVQASTVGADAIYVLHTQRRGIKEYTGSAKAIKCLPV